MMFTAFFADITNKKCKSSEYSFNDEVLDTMKEKVAIQDNYIFFYTKRFFIQLYFTTPVSKFLKSKSAYRAKEAKENTFFEDIQLVSKAVKNNSCQTVIPTTKRDC